MLDWADDDIRELLLYDLDVPPDRKLHVISDPCSKAFHHNVGAGLWQAALELLDFTAGQPDGTFQGLRVLEVGAGLGVNGQALQLLGAQVTLTDRAVQLPLLRRNVAQNFGHAASMPSVLELDWGSDPATHSAGPAVATYDIIIGSDVAYDEDFYDALLNWVAAFLAQSPATQVILGIPDRPETRPFWDCVAMHNLAWRYLRRIARPDLATPISICQLFWQPQKPHGVMPLVSRSGSPAANPNTQEGTVSTPARNAQRMLFVFDFDWSLVEENSDIWVLDILGATPQFQCLKTTGLPWTQLMDAALLAAGRELGSSKEDVLAACQTTPLAACMQQAVRDLGALEECDMVILSDANTVFIAEILRHHSLLTCFRQVISNEGVWEEGTLRVRPHHQAAKAHGCPRCPPNLCKGLVLERLLLQHSYARVVYLGDGSGDVCPCTRLGAHDFVLARSHYPDGAACPLLRAAEQEGACMADCFEAAHIAQASQGLHAEEDAAIGGSRMDVAAAGRRLKAWEEWRGGTRASSESLQNMMATVCAWETPAEAAALLRTLSRPLQ